MSTYTTQQIFDEFFEGMDPNFTKRIRPSVERPELTAYEEKIGKQFYQFTVDEAYEMLRTFRPLSDGDELVLRPRTYTTIVGWYRRICDEFFRKHPECICVNAYSDKRMAARNVVMEVATWIRTLTIEDVRAAIIIMNKELPDVSAVYNECLIELGLCGVADASEMVNIKEEDVDFDNRIITVKDRFVVMNDRLAEILPRVHTIATMEGGKRDFNMFPYRGSYLRFASKTNSVTSIDDREEAKLAQFINVRFQYMRKITQVDLTTRRIYELGFYLHMLGKYGEENLRAMVYENVDTEILLKEAQDYGFPHRWVSPIQQMLIEHLH